MDIMTTITEFKQHLKAAGYADTTMDSYRKNLDQFSRYLKSCDIADIRKVTHEVIRKYQQTVAAQPIASESKALKIRPVKRLFEYLVKSHKLLINPTEGIVETTRKNRKIGHVLKVEEIKKLMEQPNLSLRTGIRDRAMMEVFYATAIRLDELMGLDVYHVDLTDKVIYIRKAKGKKQRVVPLGNHATKYLKEYLENIRSHYTRKNPRLRRVFLMNTGKAMTDGCIRANLYKYRMEANIEKPVSPHTFRRSCATHLLEAGVDIRYIQKLLGHRHLKTTHAYTRVKPVQVKQTHDKTHPNKNR